MKISLTTEVTQRKKTSVEVENVAYIPGWVASLISKQCSVCLYEFEDNETVAVLTFKTTMAAPVYMGDV